jgi:hypothetical protein
MSRATEHRPIVVIVQHPKASTSVVLLKNDDGTPKTNIKDVTRWIEDEKRKWPATRYTAAYLEQV